MCSKETVSIKTENDVEMQLGIKTEPQQPSTSSVTDSLTNNWQKEKEGLVQQIVNLKSEHQRVVLSLKQLQSEFSSLSLEKAKLNEEVSAKESLLLGQKEELQALLTQLQIKFDEMKEQDAKAIASLTRENKTLMAQVKQLQSGISHHQKFENSQRMSTNDLDAIDDNVYDVEAIIDHKGGKNSRKYLVRWKGFGASDDTWESESSFCIEILKQYKKDMFSFVR